MTDKKLSCCEACTTKSEDLEEELHSWMRENCDDNGFFNPLELASHFVEWQKQNIKEALQAEYEKGRFDMREEMMKDAVEGYISLCHDYPYRRSLVAIEKGLTDLKYAQKIKIIIIKTEQQ